MLKNADARPSQRPRLRPRNTSSQRPLPRPARNMSAYGLSRSVQRQPFRTNGVLQQTTESFGAGTSASATDHMPSIGTAGSCSSDVPTDGAYASQRSSTGMHRTGFSNALFPPVTRFVPCDCVCSKCQAVFWYEERLSTSTRRSGPLYHRCCMGGKVRLFLPRDYPPYIRQLFSDPHFLKNIRAYNQMFSMTSLGASIDDSVNVGRGPYIFKVSGQIYHRIGRFCPEFGKSPRFLQLYIFDTHNEVANRLANFNNNASNVLRPDIVQGLIELLDAHNALVQFFRTARDKLLDTNVPEFRIRLFGAAGSAQHELPTADEVGAIVFDNGPDGITDFDVVIQYHSGEPERVNKLHPAYMSLHFPLLFIFGEQGYHTDLRLLDVTGESSEGTKRMSMDAYYAYLLHDRLDRQTTEKIMETVTTSSTGSATPSNTEEIQRSLDKGKGIMVEEETVDIMNLKPQDLGKPLEIKVFKKWASKNVPDPNPTGLCFIFLDKKGGAVQANVQIWDMRDFDSKLQVNGCYRIQAYGCKRTDKWQRTLENDITLLLGRYTQVTEIQDTGFPAYYFNFAAYNQVAHRVDSRDSILTDYIGIIIDVANIRESGDSMTNRISRRNIEIQNLNGNVIVFTLWNEQETGFPVNLCRQVQQPPIIVVTSCWAKRFGGTVHHYATHNHTTYEDYMGPLPPLPLPPPEAPGDEQEPAQPHMQIRDLLAIKPETNALLSYVSDPDPYTLPEIIRDLEHTKHIFTVHIAPGSRRGNTKYILEHATDAPQPTVPNVPPPIHEPQLTTTVTEQPPENLSPETPQAALGQQELSTMTEITTTEITPPPGTDESTEKTEYHPPESSTTVRRQLFTQVPEGEGHTTPPSPTNEETEPSVTEGSG
ncbi:helitron helicase-like domain-containing protein [Artemisia annua]|uniref:Helitron helicase-like domain-containing protein n=1 Tax=Artemisia annua TaxID=35608 RepID=A0A2U1MEW3_ARTAN|nr:helitron helicase-like domain-containing protein [Artemisia annua]